MTKAYMQMSVGDALYAAARKYPGSVEALAARMDKSPKVLRSKLTPDTDTHHLTLEEALQIIELLDVTVPSAADLAVNAIAYRLSRVCYRHDGVDSEDTPIEIQTLALGSLVGLLFAEVAVAARASGARVSKKQADAISSAIARSLKALFVLDDTVSRLKDARS